MENSSNGNGKPSRNLPSLPARERPLWADAYVAALAECGTHTDAAKAAQITREHAVYVRRINPEFGAECQAALERFSDSLESAAVMRARDGIVETFVGKDGTLYENRRYSDRLLETLLRANRPDKYREKIDVLVVIRNECRRIAEQSGLDANQLIAEAERIVTGQASP